VGGGAVVAAGAGSAAWAPPGAARDPLFAHILARHTPKSDFDIARPVAPRSSCARRRPRWKACSAPRIGPREILRHRDGIAINDAVPRIADLLGLLDRERPPAPGSSAFAQTLQRLQGQAGSALPHA
jgi:hypothetical protein